MEGAPNPPIKAQWMSERDKKQAVNSHDSRPTLEPVQLKSRLFALARENSMNNNNKFNPLKKPQVSSLNALEPLPQIEAAIKPSLKRAGEESSRVPKTANVQEPGVVIPPIATNKTKKNKTSVEGIDSKKTTQSKSVLECIEKIKKDEFHGFIYMKPSLNQMTEKKYLTRNLYDLEAVDYIQMDRANGFVTLSKQVRLYLKT